jgi:hypothetical protein
MCAFTLATFSLLISKWLTCRAPIFMTDLPTGNSAFGFDWSLELEIGGTRPARKYENAPRKELARVATDLSKSPN